MKTKALSLLWLAISISAASARAEAVSAICNAQASEYAFTKYSDDDFDYIEAISEASALDAVEQNNTGLSEGEIGDFRAQVQSGDYEFYQVSAGTIGDFIHLLIYRKSDCSHLNTIRVFEE